ncbi:PadR family transcriptional regulator [Microbacterium sp. JZ37]|uniref:PadR family transcriptional regulator n=1 Tax=Microbacterium sp. JZ37 TaxID=2654193 RepID=UPI002B4857EB|nr:PadR family transcriptional regulator [Microbacterium sp. JZ37]WRH18740.1 PadR family transcriptional regulator [Microbacterium sp. JZ37]
MSLRHGLLGLLAEAPASGYDLAKRFEELLGAVWPARHPQIYGELARLRDEGLIEIESEGARARKVYRLTSEGEGELHRWLLSEPDHTLRYEPLLRSFFFWTLTPAELLDVAVAEAAHYRTLRDTYAQIAQAKEASGHTQTPSGRSVRTTLEAGVRLYDALAEWAEWVSEQARKDQSGSS